MELKVEAPAKFEKNQGDYTLSFDEELDIFSFKKEGKLLACIGYDSLFQMMRQFVDKGEIKMKWNFH
jgi:hypothetical protein